MKHSIIISLAVLLLFPLNMRAEVKYNITVAQDGTGDYTTIQQAIDGCKAFPDSRITLFIKNGTYHEKVKIHAWNPLLTLRGESKEKTIITFEDHFDRINQGRNSTFQTYTLLVDANDCILENLSIINSSGPVGQAVALHVEGDKCSVINCKILGHQDTLYVSGNNSRHFFKHCLIAGSTDFIFGNATALFQDCDINSKSNSYITAASTDEGRHYGFVFRNCHLTADKGVDQVYLGRPWRPFAQTVFITCEMDAHIVSQGWHDWHKIEAHESTFYAEYNCKGNGFSPKTRVPWSHQLDDASAKKYAIPQLFNGWLPLNK